MMHDITWKGKRIHLGDKNMVVMKIDNGDFWGNLPLYLDEVNHSPTGFEWGFYGSGPSQLAYAILRSYFVIGRKYDTPQGIRKAKSLYMLFKQDFVAKWHGEEWEISSDMIEYWVSTQKIKEEQEGWI